MKKLISMLLILLITPLTLAQIEPEVDAGITPDHPLYGLDVFFDNLRIGFAGNNLEKARIRLEIAEERACEMREVAKLNKLEAMDRAKREQEIQVIEIEELQEDMNDFDKNQIQERLQKHIMVLERVKEQVPEVAKESIQRAIDNSEQAFERTQAKISVEERITEEEMEEKIERGEVKIKTAIRR